jgi:ketosteroid isomerase-like protein
MAQTKTATKATDEATGSASSQKPQRKRITRRKAVEQQLRSYFEAMDNRDAHAMASHWREDGVEDIVPVGVLRGHDELRDYFASLFAAMPDARTTVTRLVAGEQSCAVEWRLEATLSGKHIEIRGFDLFELEDGELVSNTAYFDGAGLARQVGMLPPDGSGADRAMKGAFNAVTKLRRAVAERRNGS